MFVEDIRFEGSTDELAKPGNETKIRKRNTIPTLKNKFRVDGRFKVTIIFYINNRKTANKKLSGWKNKEHKRLWYNGMPYGSN